MNTKESILKLLEANKNEYISGQQIASDLGISRNAIWKAINDLRSLGYEINAVKNRGYKLDDNNDILSAVTIAGFLSDKASYADIKVFDALESTNRTAKEMAVKEVRHGTVIIAGSQWGGVGHLGSSFVSPQGGLYLSIILDPEKIPLKQPGQISAWIAVSVCKAFDLVCSLDCSIKLVTDIFYKEEKVSGIMTESAFDLETNRLQWIVAGIGIPTHAKGLRNQFAAHIINSLLSEEVTSEEVLSYYKSKWGQTY